ncbi:MmpS family protein [Streptomyces koelreuteriae]|uniref:MmpS family protein n=1 Tax=Streptomyces koelreuteriae TaxID=2838015 RepID=A0ABX8G4S4_9ACTN|nr:MmpS family protein [Streptomyces koelreuteriae]
MFKVWGSAPSGVDITYGNDGTNLQGKGLPMEKTLSVKDDALYYQVTAQLMGGGDIQCSVTIDGETKSGRAQGGYNICSAQLNSDFSGGFS